MIEEQEAYQVTSTQESKEHFSDLEGSSTAPIPMDGWFACES